MSIQIEKKLYDSLSETEKVVAEYIMKNEEKVLSSSITGLARLSFSSSSTVSRTIQKMGFSGIAQLRYEISSKEKVKTQEESSYQMSKVIYKVYNETNKTIDGLNVVDILKIANAIKKARQIFIVAKGASAFVAHDFEQFLQYLGYHITVITETDWMHRVNFLATKDDIAIILTVQCSDPTILIAAKLFHSVGTSVFTCCCKDNTGLENYSDIFVLSHTEAIMKVRGLTNYSRIPLMIFTRTITEYLSYD